MKGRLSFWVSNMVYLDYLYIRLNIRGTCLLCNGSKYCKCALRYILVPLHLLNYVQAAALVWHSYLALLTRYVFFVLGTPISNITIIFAASPLPFPRDDILPRLGVCHSLAVSLADLERLYSPWLHNCISCGLYPHLLIGAVG